MKRESSGPILSTVFVDYDNIYLSLKRKSDEAAKRFSKESALWLQALISGDLITMNAGQNAGVERRLAMSRCYGNPVPRRNSTDNSTDMSSFPFIRHHYLRSGFEVIDCPPLTAQLKNSADIRIVMDIRDILNHDTYFDEFIILSGDADFTPVLHRLRAHARRTIIFANDHTAQPYTAICDGEVREANLINFLLNGRAVSAEPSAIAIAAAATKPVIDLDAARKAIVSEVVMFVRQAPQAVPLETLADRAVRVVGRERTIGSNWAGYGQFRDLLLASLPDDIHLSDTPPYTVFDASRHISPSGLLAPQQALPTPEPAYAPPAPQPQIEVRQARIKQSLPPVAPNFSYAPAEQAERARAPEPAAVPRMPYNYQPPPPAAARPAPMPEMYRAPPPQMAAPVAPSAPPAPSQNYRPVQRSAEQATQIQQSIARIHEACQAPALAPAEYRIIFDVLAKEIGANGLQGAQTLGNVIARAREYGLDLKRDDLRFIVDVVSESDPWFEQGASANLFSSRFRNFVVARCRSQGLSLSADELDLIEAWFSAQPPQQQRSTTYGPGAQQPQMQAPVDHAATQEPQRAPAQERWWNLEEGRQHIAEQRSNGTYGAPQAEAQDEFPRIVRSRLRG